MSMQFTDQNIWTSSQLQQQQQNNNTPQYEGPIVENNADLSG